MVYMGGGIWTDITATYAGLYFRAEGTVGGTDNSSGAFNAGGVTVQGEGLPNIEGRFGNDAAFSIDIHSGFWNGRQEGYEWNTIYPNSGAEWRQIHWDGDSPTGRGYGASPPDTLGLNQLNAQGNWQRRIEWTTGLGNGSAYSGNVYGNGEYWPRDTMTCNIKNMLPTV